MANYWAITIGINQYRHLQPLRHAQNDALFMHRFFVEEAGIPSDHCVLLSDLATSVGHQVVYPDKPAIAEWIHTITQQVSSGDIVWVFFSGYGVQLEESDYLMPIDGNPEQIEDTGIAVADLIGTLAQLPAAQTLLVLDINRSQGALAGQSIGTEVMDLAQQQQIPTLLSCQPEQYSHETLGVRHGLFTAALLEALQQNCTTLSQISDYVTKRLPELCDHHWRPIQNLVSLVPEGQGTAAVVPEGYPTASVDTLTSESARPKDRDYDLVAERLAACGLATGSLAGEKPSIEPPWKAAAIAETDIAIATPATNGTEVDGTEIDDPDADLYVESVQPPIYSEETDAFDRYGTAGADQSNGTHNGAANGATASSAIVPYQKPSASAVSGAKLRNWGLFALALLVGGVLLKQPFVAASWEGLSKKIGIPTLDGKPQADASGDANNNESAGSSIDPVTTVDDDAAAPDAADDSDSPDAADSAAPAAAGTSAGSDTAAGEQEQIAGKALIARASNALKQRQYSDALIALQQVPQSQRDTTFSSVLTQARAGAAEAQQANASVLTDARTAIQPTQASQFADAIAKARSIQSGEPYYEEAQQDIRSWSQIILDIAEGRATSGNLDRAIAAAGVMPYDNAEFHKKAQERIAFWQQRQRSRDIIFAARQIPASGQASTYQKGIVKLREVPIEHPEYETAQQLADEWSERIFSIAQARAAQGRTSDAIQAAILVPAGTTAYEPAQQAIKRWQG